MISVTEWGEYIERLAEASGRIKSCLVVADIAHLKEKLKETDTIEYPLLVGVIPSAYSSTTNDEDNVSELNVCLLFVLSPILRDYDSDTELNNYRDTHEALVDIKRTIRQDYFNCEQYPLLREIKFKSYVQEPEWNMLDLMGWSLGFEVETGEYSSTEPMPPMPPQPPVPPTYSGLRYEYTNEGLVIYQDVKNNYEEDGTFILLIQVGTNDPIMLRAWINTRETYTFATKALNLDNAQTYEVIAFDYTMQETARITLPAYDIFTYGTLTSIYADDADYNDIIHCELTVTNNSNYQGICTVNFKLGNYIVHVQQTITANSSVVLECTFENIDIFQENIVTAIDLQNNTIGTVIISATAKPVFEIAFTSGTFSARLGRHVESFITYLQLEDESIREVNINNFADATYIAITQLYTLETLKYIRVLDTFYITYLYLTTLPNCNIAQHEIEKLTNLTSLYLHTLPNCNIAQHEIEKLTKLTYLLLFELPNCNIAQHEIEKLTKLTYLYLRTLPNCNIAQHEIEKLTKLTDLNLHTLSNCNIAQHEIEKLTNLNDLLLYALPNCNIAQHEIEKLTNLTYLYLYALPNCNIAQHEIEKLVNLTHLYLYVLPSCNIAQHEIEKLTKLTLLYLATLPNCYIVQHEIEKLIKLNFLYLAILPNCNIAQHEIEKLTKLTSLYLITLPNCNIAEHEIEKLTKLTILYLATLPNCYVAQHEIEKLTLIPKTTQIYIHSIARLEIASNEAFPTHYLTFNNNNMTSTDVDNVFISCHAQLLAGFAAGTKNVNVAGATNAKVTAASLAARTYLLARGYKLTFNS